MSDLTQLNLIKSKIIEKRHNLEEFSITDFVQNCQTVANEYNKLASAYVSESEDWIEMVKELLKCLQNSITIQENSAPLNVNEILAEIKKIKHNYLDAGAETKIKNAISKAKKINELIISNELTRSKLEEEKENKCGPKLLTSNNIHENGKRRKVYTLRRKRKSNSN